MARSRDRFTPFAPTFPCRSSVGARTAGPNSGPALSPSFLIAPVEARQGLPVAIVTGAAS